MKTTTKTAKPIIIPWLILFLFFIQIKLQAQNPYPTTPGFDQMISDIKNDSYYNVWQSLSAIGLDEKYHSKVKFEKINANDKKNFITDQTYYKYNAASFNDRMDYYIIAIIPKEAFNATYRLPLRITYQRYEEIDGNWMILSKWKYYGFSTYIEGMVSPTDLKVVSDADKKKVMEEYLKTHLQGKENLSYSWKLKKITQVVETAVYTKNAQYGSDNSTALGKYVWRLILKADEADDADENGIKSIRYTYYMTEFDVTFKDGKYEVNKLNIFTDNVSESEVKESGMNFRELETKKFDSPKKIGNLYHNGWDAVYGHEAPFLLIPCTIEDANENVLAIADILKTFTYKDDSESSKINSFTSDEYNFNKYYDEVKKEILNQQLPTDILKIELIDTQTRLSDYKDTWEASNGWVPAHAKTAVTLTYKITYQVLVTKKKKETRERTEDIYYHFTWKCNDNKFEIIEY